MTVAVTMQAPGAGLVPCLVMAALAALVGCGDPDDAGDSDVESSVAGQWCKIEVATAADCVGDEGVFLELEQSGTTVTGQQCEAYEHDCQAVDDGELDGEQLTFTYALDDEPVTVEATFTLSSDASTLSGTYRIAGGDDELAVVLTRI